MHKEISNKKQNKPKQEKEMSFWEHLEELRMHIFRSLVAILILAIVAFLNKRIIFDYIILAPKDMDFITNRFLCQLGEILSIDALCIGRLNLSIQNINMSGQFMTHLYVSLIAGLIVAAPYIIWELWRFIMPALKQKEKKYSTGAVAVSSLLFLAGVLFAYFLIVPLTINFLGTYQVSHDVPNQINLNSYISTVVSVTIAVGIVFELPILVFFLTKVGILTPAFMKKNRKIMLVIVLILSAIITPPDVFSQILVCIPLVGLYELSIRISEKVYRQREVELAG
ncbi:MAG: twin-arginine translocase subunit TatC [Bacteroidetes bacterium]|nr:twin-arginine translocase subunit TatC [Bacteroidota bacterium]